MLEIFAIVAPLFIAMGIGFAAVRFAAFTKADIRIIGRFVIQFALPALLFKALAERSFDEIINVQYLGAYAAGSLITLAICAAGARALLGAGRATVGMVAVGSALSNSGFIGFPVIIQFMGTQATVALALAMLVENLLVLPISLILAEQAGAGHKGPWQTLRGIFSGLLRNPLIQAIVVGFTFSLLRLELPAPVGRVVDMFALASGPAALFVIGGTLVGLRPTGDLPRIAWVCVGKLVLHPLFVFLALLVFTPADPMLRAAAVIIASLPMLSIFPILAQKYGEESWCAAALLVATVSSFLSMSLVMWLVGGPPY